METRRALDTQDADSSDYVIQLDSPWTFGAAYKSGSATVSGKHSQAGGGSIMIPADGTLATIQGHAVALLSAGATALLASALF